MMRFALMILVSLPGFMFSALPSKAADAPQPLTINDCLNLLQGVNGLDGHVVIVNAGKPNEAPQLIPYKFENPELRKAIQGNLVKLQGIQRDVDQVRQKVFAEVSPTGTDIQPSTPERVNYDKQLIALGNSTCQVALVRIKWDDLRLKDNDIPGSVLAALDKILDK